ncbi:MAG: type II toxin-antitoxin system VapC family toxin [Planctomycetes bacterium]|nr:type II toxin-antitoxin system VapC family toxin [Planctomycetota bacterium]
MKPSVYVETTVIGYLTSWPSDNLVVAGHQRTTREWWEFASERFALMVSELVVRESGRGDSQAVKDRNEALRGLPVLGISDAADRLANELVSKGAIPQSEPEDALHVATAVVDGVQYISDLEFQAHRQCGHARQDSPSLRRRRFFSGDDLLARSTPGVMKR